MRLSNMQWPEVSAYFENEDTVIFTVGSIESHGKHMPLGTDSLIPEALLERVEEKTSLLIAPGISYGSTNYLREFPGTIDLGDEILTAVLVRLCDEFMRHGAKHIAVINGHGGNVRPLQNAALHVYRKGGIMAILNWWLMAWDINPAWKGGHGGAEETAAIMGIDPSLVNTEVISDLHLKPYSSQILQTGFAEADYKGVKIFIPRPITSATKDGWVGHDHPKDATLDWGKEMLDSVADYIVDFLGEFKKIPL